MFRYLAHDMEEDEEDDKQSIFPWLFGKHYTGQDVALFQKNKNELWIAMDYRANVSLNCCKKVYIDCTYYNKHSFMTYFRQYNH